MKGLVSHPHEDEESWASVDTAGWPQPPNPTSSSCSLQCSLEPVDYWVLDKIRVVMQTKIISVTLITIIIAPSKINILKQADMRCLQKLLSIVLLQSSHD